MKKLVSFLAVIMLLQLFQQSNAQEINLPEEGDIMHCRCKDNVDGEHGCYAGNRISLRVECGTGHGSVKCWEYHRGCAKYEGGGNGEVEDGTVNNP